MRLVDESGRPLPVGATATLLSTGARMPVGYGGETYAIGLGDENVLEVTRADGLRCLAPFAMPRDPGAMPLLGPVTCRRAA